jgi:chemotaxis protein methyltransferase CheR
MLSEQVDEIEVRLLLEAINARYGYDFRDYASRSMRRRVHSALLKSGAAHLGELQHRVLHDPSVFSLVVSMLTVQVTELFRDPEFYRAFREHVLPVLRTYPQIKIWHAGCATGEEVFSTAILLAEAGLSERAQVYATDISSNALVHAREGMYPESRLEEFTKNYEAVGVSRPFTDFYTRAYGNITFNEPLRKNVVFFQHDLVSGYALGEMHVIFCRNVLIYFNTPLRAEVMGTFRAALCRGGFLCLGRHERLSDTAKEGFEPYLDAARVYKREAKQ